MCQWTSTQHVWVGDTMNNASTCGWHMFSWTMHPWSSLNNLLTALLKRVFFIYHSYDLRKGPCVFWSFLSFLSNMGSLSAPERDGIRREFGANATRLSSPYSASYIFPTSFLPKIPSTSETILITWLFSSIFRWKPSIHANSTSQGVSGFEHLQLFSVTTTQWNKKMKLHFTSEVDNNNNPFTWTQMPRR